MLPSLQPSSLLMLLSYHCHCCCHPNPLRWQCQGSQGDRGTPECGDQGRKRGPGQHPGDQCRHSHWGWGAAGETPRMGQDVATQWARVWTTEGGRGRGAQGGWGETQHEGQQHSRRQLWCTLVPPFCTLPSQGTEVRAISVAFNTKGGAVNLCRLLGQRVTTSTDSDLTASPQPLPCLYASLSQATELLWSAPRRPCQSTQAPWTQFSFQQTLT